MIALDTSIVVAAFAPWHDFHEQAVAQLDRTPRVPAHAVFEAYSVLTRLPPALRAPPEIVADYLEEQFPQPYLILPEDHVRALIAELRALGIVGGATYDAVVSATARAADATLVSCDRRAALIYERLGVAFELIS